MSNDDELASLGTRAGSDARHATRVFVKWISANDAGTTGSHQAGFHLPIGAGFMFFSRPGLKGENMKQPITIEWVGHGFTESMVTWYGKGTRSEYRLTRLGRDHPTRGEDRVGSLLVLHDVEGGDHEYRGHVLVRDQEITAFFESSGLGPGDAGCVIEWGATEDSCLSEAAAQLLEGRPTSPSVRELAALARVAADSCATAADGPDDRLTRFLAAEREVHAALDESDFGRLQSSTLARSSVEQMLQVARPILARRTERAQRSLEYHVGALLKEAGLRHTTVSDTMTTQAMDLCMPSYAKLADPSHPADQLVAVAVRSTARDAWKAFAQEAERAALRFIVTTQPLTLTTLTEMAASGVRVVVPKPLHRQFDPQARLQLLTFADFMDEATSAIAR